MILFLETNGDRKFWRINSMEDMHEVFQMYPNTYHAAMEGQTLEEAVDNVSEYLSSHHMNSWVEGDELTKSLRHKAAALGMALTTALSTHLSNNAQAMIPPSGAQQNPTQNIKHDDFGSHPHDSFLWNLMQSESSGGRNTDHPIIQHGVAKGQKAIGRWGLIKPLLMK